ncbi:hypothetical protein HDV62DRAFT_395983 [Trichoderma sp. SZMC 28011]
MARTFVITVEFDEEQNHLLCGLHRRILKSTTQLRRLKAMMPDRIVTRVHQYDLELKAFMAAEDHLLKVMEVDLNASNAERGLIKMMNKYFQDRFQERSPAADEFSLSSQLRAKQAGDRTTKTEKILNTLELNHIPTKRVTAIFLFPY